MGSINVKHSADITGFLCLEPDGDKILIECDDFEIPISLKDFFDDFDGKPVKITISHRAEV